MQQPKPKPAAVRAVPAKYKKKNTRTNYKKYENSNRTTGMSWKYCTFNLGYASQHSHGKKPHFWRKLHTKLHTKIKDFPDE
jgi:hypothetical protein